MSISNLIPSMRNSFVIREREDYKSTKHFNTKNVTNTIQYIMYLKQKLLMAITLNCTPGNFESWKLVPQCLQILAESVLDQANAFNCMWA